VTGRLQCSVDAVTACAGFEVMTGKVFAAAGAAVAHARGAPALFCAPPSTWLSLPRRSSRLSGLRDLRLRPAAVVRPCGARGTALRARSTMASRRDAERGGRWPVETTAGLGRAKSVSVASGLAEPRRGRRCHLDCVDRDALAADGPSNARRWPHDAVQVPTLGARAGDAGTSVGQDPEPPAAHPRRAARPERCVPVTGRQDDVVLHDVQQPRDGARRIEPSLPPPGADGRPAR
jgi:hypothetical protein